MILGAPAAGCAKAEVWQLNTLNATARANTTRQTIDRAADNFNKCIVLDFPVPPPASDNGLSPPPFRRRPPRGPGPLGPGRSSPEPHGIRFRFFSQERNVTGLLPF